MAHLRYVTLTGAGEGTSFARLARLSEAFPFAEWGVLYSPSRAGQDMRYPSLEWLQAFARKANGKRLNIALHLCGAAVKDMLELAQSAGPYASTAPHRHLLELVQSFGRVQLNLCAKPDDLELLERAVKLISRCERRTRVIVQWNEHNAPVCRALWHLDAFEVLLDSSGGRGVERTQWSLPELEEFRRIGFAGGLGPQNVAQQLPAIAQAAGDRAFCIDMEDRLRDDADRFDLDRCERVLSVARDFVAEQRRLQGALHGKGRRAVSSLRGLWLDWWVGAARGVDMLVPPPAAVGATTLYRPTGRYEGYAPSQDKSEAVRLLADERVSLVPGEDGRWTARAQHSSVPMTDKDMVVAGLRAVVAAHFGRSVPKDPANVPRK